MFAATVEISGGQAAENIGLADLMPMTAASPK
jgi:hypothetical protein